MRRGRFLGMMLVLALAAGFLSPFASSVMVDCSRGGNADCIYPSQPYCEPTTQICTQCYRDSHCIAPDVCLTDSDPYRNMCVPATSGSTTNGLVTSYSSTRLSVGDGFTVIASEDEYSLAGHDNIRSSRTVCSGSKESYSALMRVTTSYGYDSGWDWLGTSPGTYTHSFDVPGSASSGFYTATVESAYARYYGEVDWDYSGCAFPMVMCSYDEGARCAYTNEVSRTPDTIIHTETTTLRFTSGSPSSPSPTCDSVAAGTECDSSRDGIDSYCSYGSDTLQQAGEQGYCCPTGSWWDATAGICIGTEGCRNDPTPASAECSADPISNRASYLADVGTDGFSGCVNIGPSLPINENACCDTGLNYGEANNLHSYQNILDVSSGAALTGVEFCGSGPEAFTLDCGVNDGYCPEDYSALTCGTPDPDCDNPPTINEFSINTNTGTAPFTATFTIDVADDRSGMDVTVDFGDGGTPYTVTANTNRWTITRTYQIPGTHTATLSVTDSAGASAPDQTIDIQVNQNPGSPGGTDAEDPVNCAPGACYGDHPTLGQACYSDGGQAVCLEQYYSDDRRDDICVGGTWRDKDESLVYASQDTATCDPVQWSDLAWCESATIDDQASGRCDTAANPTPNAQGLISTFACGDDNNEYFHTYTREGVTYQGCLASPSGVCFGMDRSDGEHSYPGTEVCSDPLDDQNCDGLYPQDDPACGIEIYGDVYVNESGNNYWTKAGDAVVTTVDSSGAVTTVRANSQGNFTITGLDYGTYTTSAEWLGYLSGDRAVTATYAPESRNYVELYITETTCDATCSVGGACSRSCLGQDACPSLDEMTLEQQLLFNRSAPIHSSRGADYDARVLVDWNVTHRLVGTHCYEEIAKIPAPRAELEGEMSNLIKWTRLVTLEGSPVRLVVASWS